jgi:CheY-like chemotaxis protein
MKLQKRLEIKMGATIPIIAITAGTVEINECIAAGMNDYISKPIIKRVRRCFS